MKKIIWLHVRTNCLCSDCQRNFNENIRNEVIQEGGKESIVTENFSEKINQIIDPTKSAALNKNILKTKKLI